MRQTLTSVVALAALGSVAFGSLADAKIFENDTFLVAQEAADSFGLFINGNRERTLTGAGDLTATFTDPELQQLILANNDINLAEAATAVFFEILPKDLIGLFSATITGTGVELMFSRELVTGNASGVSSFKYNTAVEGSDRNFVQITGQALEDGDDGGDDDPIVVVGGGEPGSEESGGSRGGAGPFYNDTFTITQTGTDTFELDINGVSLGGIVDSSGDIAFQIPEDTLKALLLVNNGVTGDFLGSKTEFFDFLAKGNAGLIDVTLGSNIGFSIDRSFVTNELSGESSFKYDAGGKKVRNFVNFVGVVDLASPSS